MSNIKDIAAILPEGIDRSHVEKIAKLIEGIVNEQVQDQITELATKTRAFLRLRMDKIQEGALKELEEGNETYRNAKLFEHIKGMMAFELMDTDRDYNAKQMSLQVAESTSETAAIVNDNARLVNEVESLSNSLKVLQEKNAKDVNDFNQLVDVHEALKLENADRLDEGNETLPAIPNLSDTAKVFNQVDEVTVKATTNNKMPTRQDESKATITHPMIHPDAIGFLENL